MEHQHFYPFTYLAYLSTLVSLSGPGISSVPLFSLECLGYYFTMLGCNQCCKSRISTLLPICLTYVTANDATAKYF